MNTAAAQRLLQAIYLYFGLIRGEFTFVSEVVHVAASWAFRQPNVVGHSIIIIKVILGQLRHVLPG